MTDVSEEMKKAGFCYREPDKNDPRYKLIEKFCNDAVAQNATIGVKFSNDIFLMKSFLDQQKIEYKEEDLDDSPMGKGIRIKRDKEDAKNKDRNK